MSEDVGAELEELRELSKGQPRRVCSFRSMTSYVSHYRVKREGGDNHITFDCEVAELQAQQDTENCSDQVGIGHIKRVGLLKDIWVVDYVKTNIVLMVASWVAKHSYKEPRLRQNSHGLWLANLEAMPCNRIEPYIFSSLAYRIGK